MKILPTTRNVARAFIKANHRHSKPPQGWLFGVQLLGDDGSLIAVACAGRPKARMLQDGVTVEITRVCALATIPPTANACSRLYGALCRAAQALGYTRAITYTHQDEAGISLRAANFVLVAETKGADWSRQLRLRTTEDMTDKHRWERAL